jgi:hypothetical protein
MLYVVDGERKSTKREKEISFRSTFARMAFASTKKV